MKLKIKDNNLKPNYLNLDAEGLRRSSRLKSKQQPALDSDGNLIYSYVTSTLSTKHMPTLTSIKTSVAKFIYYIEIADRLFNNALNEMNIFAFATNHEENENYTYKSML